MDPSSGTSNTDPGAKKNPFDDLSRDELVSKCKGLLSIAQKAKLAKTELQNEIESYKLQLEKCETEKKLSQESFITLQELVDSLTEQKLNIITEVDSAKSKIKALNVQCKNYEAEINKYKADLIIKDQNITDVTSKLSDLDSEVISLKRQNYRLVEENEQLINQLTEIEAKTAEFNNIGLRQREQLKILEENVQSDEVLKTKIAELSSQVEQFENQLQTTEEENIKKNKEFEIQLREMTHLYESEKSKREKVNIKLRSYKDKILKCAACITHLKNSRYILTKTVKDYSENIPKWQNDLMKASKVLDDQINQLNTENLSLKEKIIQLENDLKEKIEQYNSNVKSDNSQVAQVEKDKILFINQISELQHQCDEHSSLNAKLQQELRDLKAVYQNLKEVELTAQVNKNQLLNEQNNENSRKHNELSLQINQLERDNSLLTSQISDLQEKCDKHSAQVNQLQQELSDLKFVYQNLNDVELPAQKNENKLLKDKLDENIRKNQELSLKIAQQDKDNNCLLTKQFSELQQQCDEHSILNIKLQQELSDLKSIYQNLIDVELPAQVNENKLLKDQINDYIKKINELSQMNVEINKTAEKLKLENQELNDTLRSRVKNNDATASLNLQIKALESEKATLVKEKLNAKDSVIELEANNKVLTDQIARLLSETQQIKSELERITQEKSILEKNQKTEKESEINMLKCKIIANKEQFALLKKEYDDMQDLNNLLKEEVETLKLSLEQPKDDSEHLSDLNVSMQTDIVRLETKLAAYKQENSSLLAEIKESRARTKEFDTISAEYEEAKSKLANYKSENAELLTEMKEINQVLKERGESISKQQKAIAEMERLIETLEKDRDNVNQEKEDLLKKVEALKNELKCAEKKFTENIEVMEQTIAERDTAKKQQAESEGVISSLKEEIEKMKHNTSSADLPNEDMSTSTISKAEECSRMKDLDETFEEKYTKLRIFALKLKKKLNETTTLLQNTEQDKAKLEKMLTENSHTEKQTVVTKQNYSMENSARRDSSDASELQAKIQTLTGIVETSEKVSEELEKVKAELNAKTQELASEIETHKATKESLEKARRDVKKKSVLSLEMEDYERSLKELTTKMEEKKKKMVQMESTIDMQEGTITAMKTQIKLLEEQIKSEETQNRLTKEELQHAIEEGREKDSVIQTKNTKILKLEQELEDEKRKNEESDLEMTTMVSEKEHIIMKLGEDKAELNNKVKRLEFKCSELNEKLNITNTELADLKAEYTSYKVRAQAVLRQNQTVDHSQEEQLKEEAAALRTQIETLTSKLNTIQEQCTEHSTEADNARRRALEAASEVSRAQQRTARLHADLARLAQQLESERTQNKLQVSTLTQCYKSQIGELEAKLLKETEMLKKQLAAAQENTKTGKVGTVVLDEANNQYMLPVIPKDDSDGEMDINVSMIPREEGEGSESAPSPPPSKPYLTSAGSGRSPVSLERLLEEGVPEDEALDTSSLGLTSDQEIADLKRRLTAQQLRVKHVTVLLSESERECARMAQLSELLKAELRRVRGTTNNAHNTEYMKNVTLKFLTLPPGDERSRLVPVLQKILTLTHDETQKIHAVARGLDPNPSKGWGSYLPWPGGSK